MAEDVGSAAPGEEAQASPGDPGGGPLGAGLGASGSGAGDLDVENMPGMDRILDIPLTVHVELGKKRLKISELLEVGAGSVLELETQAGTTLSIYANQTLLAHGEAVVVGERYGVRITDIVSPAERVRRLGGESAS